MTIASLAAIGAVVRLRTRLYRRWDVGAAVLGAVMAAGVAPGVDTSSCFWGPLETLAAASVTPFITLTVIVVIGRLSLTITDAAILTMARRRGEDDHWVRVMRTMQGTARATYKRLVGPA